MKIQTLLPKTQSAVISDCSPALAQCSEIPGFSLPPLLTNGRQRGISLIIQDMRFVDGADSPCSLYLGRGLPLDPAGTQ